MTEDERRLRIIEVATGVAKARGLDLDTAIRVVRKLMEDKVTWQ